MRSIREFFKTGWGRHPLTLRGFKHLEFHEKGLHLIPSFDIETMWDPGRHANVPLWFKLTWLKWTYHTGIFDKPVSKEGVPEWLKKKDL
jgi:hypothetical protein